MTLLQNKEITNLHVKIVYEDVLCGYAEKTHGLQKTDWRNLASHFPKTTTANLVTRLLSNSDKGALQWPVTIELQCTCDR